MAALSPASGNRLFAIGLGLATCVVVAGMRQLLIYYRDAAAVPPSESKPQYLYITQEVEDSLKYNTLEKLLDSPNYCIQETASIIIYERALYDGTTVDVLLWYITRPEHDTREKGIRALAMIMNSATVKLLHKPAAYAALVKSLEFSIDDYPHNAFDPEWDNWQYRDVVEQGCLIVLGHLVDKFGSEGLVKSRFVQRWLTKEPWGTDDKERMNNFAEALQKTHRLNGILVPLYRDPAGRKQLIKAKLVPIELEAHLNQTRDTRMANGESTSGEDLEGVFVESRRRRDQSSEEEHIRRRHREAMVLNDGTRPLGRGDIIQRER